MCGNKQKIAIVGAGISGLSVANFLKKEFDVTVFEQNARPGGLLKCERIDGSLFHTCGGHVFNTKRQDVLNWFWSVFKENEFSKADRNSVVFMDGNKEIPYPIENHMYLFDDEILKRFIDDLKTIAECQNVQPQNFEEFLKLRFGETLYDLYFQPYNEKVWRRDLTHVSLSWLEGKLPMPSIQEMIFNNIRHVKEKAFVHSSFWYEKMNGSQFIIDKLSENINVLLSKKIQQIERVDDKWLLEGMPFDKVVFCGNIKDLPLILRGVDISKYRPMIDGLEYHGTTAVFCEIDKNPYSWIYMPSRLHQSHRIICTGNFAKSNNAPSLAENRITATIEFTDEIGKDDIMKNLSLIPLNPRYITHKYNQYTYPIQDADTRKMVQSLKQDLEKFDFYSTGRFADWEYYNMDVAVGAAIDLCDKIKNKR